MNKYGLYDYQLDSLTRMHNGCILCGGVGSGKSRTSLAYYFDNHRGDPLYIITTAHKRDTGEWEEEFDFFKSDPLLSADKVKVVIDSWNNIKKYVDVSSAFFIFDEQRVVGKGSWVKSFLKICKNNPWILLSATPGDVWMDYIPVFIANGFYKNRTDFLRQHVIYKYTPNIPYPIIDRYVSQGKLIRLRAETLVTMDYKRPAETHEVDVPCDYDKALYLTITKKRWDPWEEKPLENVSAYCYALRKAVNSCPPRQLECIELCDKHPKVIIFYNYDYELEILKNLPYKLETVIAELNGHKHDPVPTTERWVYLVQYNAGAEGWNCITTDTMIFYSLNYSYRMMAQAKGRIDRVSTKFTDLYYYTLKSRAPIDLAINRALKQKKNFNERGFSS